MTARKAVLSMFDRFTDRARRVVVLAQVEARKLNHDYIGTEHLLLGLIGEGEMFASGCDRIRWPPSVKAG